MTDLAQLAHQYAQATAQHDQAAIDRVLEAVPDAELDTFLDLVEPHAPAAPPARSVESYAAGLAAAGAGTDAGWLAALAAEEDLADVLTRADQGHVATAIVETITELQGSEPAVRRYVRRMADRAHDPRRLHERVVEALAAAVQLPVDAVRALQERTVVGGAASPAGAFRGDGDESKVELTDHARSQRRVVDELFDGGNRGQ